MKVIRLEHGNILKIVIILNNTSKGKNIPRFYVGYFLHFTFLCAFCKILLSWWGTMMRLDNLSYASEMKGVARCAFFVATLNKTPGFIRSGGRLNIK